MLLDLRSAATQCFLCRWFNEYMAFGERDQLALSYVLHAAQSPRVRLNLLPRRLHWSAAVHEDTRTCYNATRATAAALAQRFQHRASPTVARGG